MQVSARFFSHDPSMHNFQQFITVSGNERLCSPWTLVVLILSRAAAGANARRKDLEAGQRRGRPAFDVSLRPGRTAASVSNSPGKADGD